MSVCICLIFFILHPVKVKMRRLCNTISHTDYALFYSGYTLLFSQQPYGTGCVFALRYQRFILSPPSLLKGPCRHLCEIHTQTPLHFSLVYMW
jgi:hypothetical protein